jgi:hypothetical protein
MIANLIVHRVIVRRSNDEAAPLVLERTPGYLPRAEFDELRALLSDHGLHNAQTRSLNRLSTFAATRGVIMRFNSEGEAELRRRPRYAPLVKLFDRLAAPESNAFVINVLAVPPTPAGKLRRAGAAVGCHLDQDLPINGSQLLRAFTADEVAVLYARVPCEMQGGELELHPFHGWIPANGAPPAATLRPAENLLVRFRGDAYHCVRAHVAPQPEACSRAEGASRAAECQQLAATRVSVVLEQYRIPERFYWRTRRWEEEGADASY